MMLDSKGVAASAAFAALAGCSYLTPPIERPVVEDHSGHLGTFTMVAERRMVLTKRVYKDSSPESAYESKFCAEPPPDATQSIASVLTAAFKGSASGAETKPELAADLSKSLETTAKSLFQRSQGVQLFRDGLYSLCQAHLNGAITAAQYDAQYSALLTAATDVIKKEIDKSPNLDVARATEAAAASEAAKDSAVKARESARMLKEEAENVVRNAKSSEIASQAASDEAREARRKAEEAATRAEEAARHPGSL